MDITFTCKCGQEIVIDEAGAGITIDCPGCGKPVYVPSKESDKAKDTPIRVETPLAKLTAKHNQTATPPPNATRPPNPFLPAHKREDVHPAVRASLACLLILAGFGIVCLAILRHDMLAAIALLESATPFLIAAPACAIYGMCVGHVKHGLWLLATMSLMILLSYWIAWSISETMVQDMQKQLLQQFQQFQKTLPVPH